MTKGPKNIFDFSMNRIDSFFELYHTLNNERKRKAKSDWKKKFKKFMGWKLSMKIKMIEGKQSLIVLKEDSKLDMKNFKHDYLSEFLRYSLVSSVAAFDRYLHDVITDNSVSLLNLKTQNYTDFHKKINLPISVVKRAIIQAQKENSRPNTIIKKEIQNKIHKDKSLCGIQGLTDFSKIIGIKDFWKKLSDQLEGDQETKDIQDLLKEIMERRNKIVHESDIHLKTSQKKITLNYITYEKAKKYNSFIKNIVESINSIVDDHF